MRQEFATEQRCANGTDCVAYPFLGEPSKLSRGNPSSRCFACERRRIVVETEVAAAKLSTAKKHREVKKSSRIESSQEGGRRASLLACGSRVQPAVVSEDGRFARRQSLSLVDADIEPTRAEAEPEVALTREEHPEDDGASLGLIWLKCESSSVVTLGLSLALDKTLAQVHIGSSRPKFTPSSVILCTNDVASTSEEVKELRDLYPDSSILVVGMYADLSLAKVALKSGARGFLHTDMSPQQIARAIEVAAKGELVLPRALFEAFILDEEPADLGTLSARQREILSLVVEGLANAEIGRRLYLSESTVKQHLRASYKILGATNRTVAANIFRTAYTK